MSPKILTVDDSRTVRLIIRKTFAPFDCEIIEAANGAEGLAAAAKTTPDFILLDITMPVMDGVEMLTRLKADARLKAVPVMMLTAEGGRDQVLNIAKLGVKGYIVKPFKEGTLIEKVGHIIELKPATTGAAVQRSTQDPRDILIVDDKPAIIQQITDGLKLTPWRIHGAATAAEAMDVCGGLAPHLVIISLSLPEDAAFTLFRTLRAHPRTKFVPVFGLVVRTETVVQARAQEIGFTSVVTKPLDPVELRARMARAMKLDTSLYYFKVEADLLTLSLPENCTPLVLTDVGQYFRPKLAEAVDAGRNRMLIDVHALRTLEMNLIKLLLDVMQACRDLSMKFALIGNPQVISECNGLEETRHWHFHETLESAKAHLVGGG